VVLVAKSTVLFFLQKTLFFLITFALIFNDIQLFYREFNVNHLSTPYGRDSSDKPRVLLYHTLLLQIKYLETLYEEFFYDIIIKKSPLFTLKVF
jgi:hypothetical protein